MGSESEEHSENAKEQDKNQTSIGRMQSDSRSETGTMKILTVLKVSNTISSSGIAVRTLTTAQRKDMSKVFEDQLQNIESQLTGRYNQEILLVG